MKKLNKAFAIALVVTIVSISSVSTSMAHNNAGNCTHKHYITNLDGSDNHTSGSTLRSPSFDGITSCTTHDGSAGICKNKTFPGESQKRATCVKNSTNYSNRFSPWNLGRNRMHIQTPRYENPARVQPRRSEFSEPTTVQPRRFEFSEPTTVQPRRSEYSGFTPRFRTYSLR